MEQLLDHTRKIREILSQHGRLPVPVDRLEDGTDLYNAGLTSLASVGVMLALEDQFGIEFPDSMLGRRTFRSIEAIAEVVEQLRLR
jgi:acyl carrier protein